MESAKALTKALISEEAAERARNFDYLLKYVNTRTEEFERKITARLELEIAKITAYVQEMK